MARNGKVRESFLPRQRPKEEWAHVSVTRDGARYVDVQELLECAEVKALVERLRKLNLEPPHQNQTAGEHI